MENQLESSEELIVQDKGIEIRFRSYAKLPDQVLMVIHLHPSFLADENNIGLYINANFTAYLTKVNLEQLRAYIEHRLDPNYVIPHHEPNPENVNDPDLPQPSQDTLL